MNGSAYAEGATAPGAWTRRLRLPGIPLDAVRSGLIALARATGCPVDAAAHCNSEGVIELLLHRHPSRTHGTPTIAECEAMVRTLVAVTPSYWATVPVPDLTVDLVVVLGLVEGYAPGAPQHDLADVASHLPAASWSLRPARLLSARPLPTEVRWHDEPGVVIHAAADLLPAITATAAALRQERFIVTDHAARRTYVLHRRSDREGTR